jgi:tetraacyldisaccharide 4'-kinase
LHLHRFSGYLPGMADVSTWQRRLWPVLAPLGAAYGILMRFRRAAYERGLKDSLAPAAPCISIGNIAWGGAGKTPLIDRLLTWAESRGLRPCVLTRGYKAVPPAPHYLVRPDTDPAACGDEPLMLASRHDKTRVIVDPERARAAEWAAREFSPDLYFLDDGFQHLAIKRRLDLVLLRPEDLAEEWNRVIPAGSWREPASALARADAFMLKAAPGEFEKLRGLIGSRLGGFGKPVFGFHLEPVGLRSVVAGRFLSSPGDEPYVLLSATADPAAVRRTAADLLGREPVRHITRPDHYRFSKRDWLDARDAMLYSEAARVVCTAKDAVKLARFASENLYVLEVEAVFGGSAYADSDFREWWERTWVGSSGETA